MTAGDFAKFKVWPCNSPHVTVLTLCIYVTHIHAANTTRTSVFPYRKPLSNNATIQTFCILASCHREQSGQLHMSTSLSSRKLYKMEAHDRDVTAELYTPRSHPRLADTYHVVYCIKVLAAVMNSSL